MRKHPEAQIERIRASIEHFGFQCPPLIADSGEIIAGVARVEAARRLGYDELPVLVASGMSAADIKAYRIADNKLAEMSSWDREVLKLEFEAILEIDTTFDLQYAGYDTAEIDLVLNPGSSEDTGPDDEAPAPSTNAVSRVGDVWLAGPHRVVCGDALKPETYATLLQGEQARLCVSDLTERDTHNRYRTVNPKGSKEDRLAACSAIIEEGRVYLPESADWLPAFLSEVTGFPSTKHDDQVDSLSQFLNHMRRQTGGRLKLSSEGRPKLERKRLRPRPS